jgi:hypothetical protein
METKNFYKFLFVFKSTSIAVEANSKMDALTMMQEEYPRLFEENFQIIQIGREITISDNKNEYLYL